MAWQGKNFLPHICFVAIRERTKLHAVAASNNRDHLTRSLY